MARYGDDFQWGHLGSPTDRTAGDTLVGRNITDHTAPDPTALRECHFGEQHYPRQRCEQAGEERALIGHYAIIAARRGKKECPGSAERNFGSSGRHGILAKSPPRYVEPIEGA